MTFGSSPAQIQPFHSSVYIWFATPSCFKLFMQATCLDFSLALESAGSNMAASTAMMAITTSSSIKVNAVKRLRLIRNLLSPCTSRSHSSLGYDFFTKSLAINSLEHRQRIGNRGDVVGDLRVFHAVAAP